MFGIRSVCVCVKYTCIRGVCWLCVVYVEYALCMFSIHTSISYVVYVWYTWYMFIICCVC